MLKNVTKVIVVYNYPWYFKNNSEKTEGFFFISFSFPVMTLDLKLRRKSEGGHLNRELKREIRGA